MRNTPLSIPTVALLTGAIVLIHALPSFATAADGRLRIQQEGNGMFLQIEGSPKEDWRIESSIDPVNWSNATRIGTWTAGATNSQWRSLGAPTNSQQFYRARKTDGLFDTTLLRTITLTFSSPKWTNQLTQARKYGTNISCTIQLDNGVVVTNAGARYKGNSSFDDRVPRKSINLDINYIDPEARVMGYRAINLNNATGDETIMREPVYFNVVRKYTPCPHAAMVKLYINGEYRGVYSMVDQINNDLIDEWFPNHHGDRWRAPNLSPSPGGLASANSAFRYLDSDLSWYMSNYELKSDNSTNAWDRLIHATDVLNNTSTNQLRDSLEAVFAVDRWLWFFAVENIFVDEDSYWYKGADYAFYYEPESGRIHPVEHDGNESFGNSAFASEPGIDYTLSPVKAGGNRPLLNRMLLIPELRQRYLAHMRTILDESFRPSKLTASINHFHELTVTDIITDTKRNYTMLSYSNDLVALKSYVTNRYEFLANHSELLPSPPRIVSVQGPSPEPSQAPLPLVTARVLPNDPNGIESVWLYWRDKDYGRFSGAEMFDDGTHNDGDPHDGVFGATMSQPSSGRTIQYYVEARSANGAKASAFSPARAEQETYNYHIPVITATNSPVIINELMANNTKSIADPQGDFDDWVELRNLSTVDVELTGYYLTDEPANARKWRFPKGTRIPANGFLIVWADEDGSATPGLHANFKLSASGEQVLLIDTDENLNRVLDAVFFGPQQADHSYSRSAGDPKVWTIGEPSPGSGGAPTGKLRSDLLTPGMETPGQFRFRQRRPW